MPPEPARPPAPSPVRLRRAEPADAPTLQRAVAAVARESEGRTPDPRIVATGLAAALADPLHRQYYIAEREASYVGSCLVTTEWSDWTATWYWWLQSIYVEPAARRTGVLEAMLRHVEQEAQAAGVRLVRLYVHEENARARRAYARAGYREVAYRVAERDT